MRVNTVVKLLNDIHSVLHLQTRSGDNSTTLQLGQKKMSTNLVVSKQDFVIVVQSDLELVSLYT